MRLHDLALGIGLGVLAAMFLGSVKPAPRQVIADSFHHAALRPTGGNAP
jgi:hypothetical protein